MYSSLTAAKICTALSSTHKYERVREKDRKVEIEGKREREIDREGGNREG